jgi:Protein of unknown function (DUF3253)
MHMTSLLAPTDEAIAQEIEHQLSRRAATSSICPSEVARALQGDEAEWRALMPRVREVAAVMRDEGRLRITSRGVDVAKAELHRGAIRLMRGPSYFCGEHLPIKRKL